MCFEPCFSASELKFASKASPSLSPSPNSYISALSLHGGSLRQVATDLWALVFYGLFCFHHLCQYLCTEHGRTAAASYGAIKHQPITTGNKINQEVSVSSTVALLKLKKRSFIPVNLLHGTDSMVQVSSH